MKLYRLIDSKLGVAIQRTAAVRMSEEAALLANRDTYLIDPNRAWIEADRVNDKGVVGPKEEKPKAEKQPKTAAAPKPAVKINPLLVEALEKLGYKKAVATRKAATVDADLELDIALQTIFASGA